MTEINENVEYYEAEILDENYEDSGSGHGGLIGVGIALGVGALAAGAAFVADKKGVFDDFKTERRIEEGSVKKESEGEEE